MSGVLEHTFVETNCGDGTGCSEMSAQEIETLGESPGRKNTAFGKWRREFEMKLANVRVVLDDLSGNR